MLPKTIAIVPIVTGLLKHHGLAGTPMVAAADAGKLSQNNLNLSTSRLSSKTKVNNTKLRAEPVWDA